MSRSQGSNKGQNGHKLSNASNFEEVEGANWFGPV